MSKMELKKLWLKIHCKRQERIEEERLAHMWAMFVIKLWILFFILVGIVYLLKL